MTAPAGLSDVDAARIRRRWVAGERQVDLAAEFKVSQGTISKVTDAICRKHINLTCHICGKVKSGLDFKRTLYELAFHYDRRHRGWTQS